MNKIIISLIFVALFLLSALEAKEIYIKVAAVNSRGLLFNISYDLKSYGYKMHVNEKGIWYHAYSGPFYSLIEAENALFNIKKYVSKRAFIIGNHKEEVDEEIGETELFEDELQEDDLQNAEELTEDISDMPVENELEKVVEVKEKIMPPVKTVIKIIKNKEKPLVEEKNDFFVAFTMGLSKYNITIENVVGNIVLDNSPRDGGTSYGLELGYYFYKNLFTTLNYQLSSLENVTFSNVYATMNYKIKKMNGLNLHVGALLGYSSMRWNNLPLNATLNQVNSFSYMIGLQVGHNIEVSENFEIYLQYKIVNMRHAASVNQSPNFTKITHTGEQNINIGVRYSF